MEYIEKFKIYYKETKEKINKQLDKLNKDLLNEKNELVKENVKLLTNLNSDGKIIRGTLVNLGYYLLKDDKDYSIPLSLAYEMFQTSILVHDDIIDKDNKRRGKDTIHFSNYNRYIKYNDNKDEVKHLSNSIALCMGDYGLYLANKIILDNYTNDKNLGRVLSNYNDTVLTTIKGEIIDVILPFHGKNKLLDEKEIEENILEIYRLKTSHYTIVGPMSVGMILAGANNEKIKDIEKFGEKVGIAFQIQDDILGIYSNEMGKVKESDIREFKQTILYSHTLLTKYKDELLKYYGKEKLTEEEVKKVQEIFKESKSYDYALNKMNSMYDEALIILSNIKWIEEDKKELLRGFIEYLRNRNN